LTDDDTTGGGNRSPGEAVRETTGFEAKTIHRLFEIDPGNGRFSGLAAMNPTRSLVVFLSSMKPRWWMCR